MSIQRTGATGILRGRGVAEGWENKTFFYPDSVVLANDFWKDWAESLGVAPSHGPDPFVSVKEACEQVQALAATKGPSDIKGRNIALLPPAELWVNLGLENYQADRPIRRWEMAVLLDRVAHVFQRQKVDFSGKVKKSA